MGKKSREEILQNASGNLQTEFLKKGSEANKLSTGFNPKQTNMARYLTYGAKTYGELGFDPIRDNDALYNSKTSAMDDVSRGFEGSMKLAKIGFTDTFAFGVAKNKNSSFDFEEVMNNYGSTRGGAGGFISNTLLSSGYTAGIMGAIAAEEIVLSGITALSGGLGGVSQAAETGRLLGKAANNLENANQIGNTLDAVQAAGDINKARGFFSQAMNKVGSTLKPLNPLDNTIDFIKGYSKIKDVSKTVVGAGALVRDMRKLYMTHSESKLEAEMSEREFFEKEYQKAEKESVDGNVSESALQEIKNRSKQVYSKVYTGNLGLIYATNAIGFDNMLKTMKGVNRGNAFLDNGLFKKTINKETGKVSFLALENPIKGLRKHLIDQRKNLTTWKGLLDTGLSSSMEGVQELGQDIIATGSKNYYHARKGVEQTKGGFLDQTFADILKFGDSEFREALGEGAEEMMSWKGLETFMSGALMGAFAAPVGLATKSTNSFLFEGGFQDTYQAVKNSKNFADIRAKQYTQRQAKAKVLTEFFNNSKNFVDFVENPILTQQDLQEEMMEAARKGDTFSFKNAQEKSFAEGIWAVMENGLEKDFKENLKYMSDKFNVKELQEIFAREDITEDNAQEFRNKLSSRAKKVDEYKKRFDAVNLEFKNPISMEGLTQKDENFLETYLDWKAYDSLRKDMVVSLGMIKDHSDRIVQLRDEFSNNMNIENVQQFSQFYDQRSMNSELAMLKESIKNNKTIPLDEEGKKQNAINEERFKNLSAYSETLAKFKTELAENKVSESTKKELYTSFAELHTQTDWSKGWTSQEINNSFDKLLDYTYLTAQIGRLEAYTGLLSSNDSRKALAEKKKDLMKEYESNKEGYILNALKEYDLKKASDKMLNDLYDAGLFFDVKELNALLKNGEMPEQVFNIKNTSIATLEEKIKAQEIIGKHIANLKKQDLLENDVRDTNKTGKRMVSDERTVADILKEYGLTEGETLDLSTEKGQEFIEALLDSENLFLADAAIIEKFTSLDLKDIKLKFVTNSDRAVDISDDGKTYTLDLRFTSNQYKVGETLSFESLISRVFAQEMISDAMERLDMNSLEMMMNEVRESLKESLNDELPVDFIPAFNEPKLFLSEILNNMEMQKFLNDIQLSTAVNEESAWEDFVFGITSLLTDKKNGFNFEGNALQKVTALLNNSFLVKEETPADEVTDEETTNEDVSDEEVIVEDDSLDSLRAQASKLHNEIQNLQKEAGEKPKSRQRRELLKLSIKANKIIDKINQLVEAEKKDDSTTTSSKIINNSYSPQENAYGSELITTETPWANMPMALKAELLAHQNLVSATATKAQIEDLMEKLQSNVELQQIVTNYNARIETEDIKKYNENQANLAETIKANRDSQVKPDTSTDTSTKPKKTLLENLEVFLGAEDFALLSKKDKAEIQAKLNASKGSAIPYTFDDVKSVVSKIKLEKAKAEVIQNIENQKIIERNIETITLGKRKVAFVNAKKKTNYIDVDITEDLIEYIKLTSPEEFIKSDEEFQKAFDALLLKQNNQKKYATTKLKNINTTEELKDFIFEMMEDKSLTPEIAKKINNRSNALGLKLALKRNVNNLNYYDIKSSKRKASNLRKKKTKLQDAKETLSKYIETIGIENELSLKAIIALGLNEQSITLELLEVILAKNNIDFKTREFYIKAKRKNIPYNTREGLADRIGESSEMFPDKDYSSLVDVIDEIIQEHATANEAIISIANQIEDERVGKQEEGDDERVDNERDNTEFFNSDAGKEFLKKENENSRLYHNSIEYTIVSGEFIGEFSDLSAKQKELYLVSVQLGLYPESVDLLVSEINSTESEIKKLQDSQVEAGPIKKIHQGLVSRLQKDEALSIEVIKREGGAVVRAKLEDGTEITFLDYKGKIKLSDTGKKLNLVLIPELKLRNGGVSLNAIEVFAGDESFGYVAENDKVKAVDNSKEISELEDYLGNLKYTLEALANIKIEPVDKSERLTAIEQEFSLMNVPYRSEKSKEVMENILNTEGLSLPQLLALSLGVKISLLSAKEKESLNKEIFNQLKKLDSADVQYKGDHVVFEEVADDDTIILSEPTGGMFNVTFSEFISGFEKLLQVGDIVGGQDLNVEVKKEQLKQVKEIYLKVFSNFEITEMNDEEIKASLIDHLKKC